VALRNTTPDRDGTTFAYGVGDIELIESVSKFEYLRGTMPRVPSRYFLEPFITLQSGMPGVFLATGS